MIYEFMHTLHNLEQIMIETMWLISLLKIKKITYQKLYQNRQLKLEISLVYTINFFKYTILNIYTIHINIYTILVY